MEIHELSLEEKIGQMFIVGLDTTNIMDKLEVLILQQKVGGIMLYKKNYKNYEEMVEVINYIKKLNSKNKVPLLIAIDQEGGRVNRMPQDFNKLPSSYKLASNSKEENLVAQAGQITGEMLAKLGINMDFAPVLDIKRFEDKHAIGDRAFSNHKAEVAKYAIDYMKELQKHNVISVIKHFPGHGATTKDTHFNIPTIKENIENLEKEDMFPFEQAIKNGADAMLVSHLKIKGKTQGLPASMSRKFITKYIRKKYRFKGLIVTDDVRMGAVKLLYGTNKPAKKAFEAGNDIVLIKHIEGNNIMEQIIKRVKRSPLKQARVNNSVKRILAMKEKYKVNDEQIELDKEWLNEINGKMQNVIDKCKNI